MTSGRICWGEKPTVYEGEGGTPADALLGALEVLLKNDPEGYFMSVNISLHDGLYYAIIIA